MAYLLYRIRATSGRKFKLWCGKCATWPTRNSNSNPPLLPLPSRRIRRTIDRDSHVIHQATPTTCRSPAQQLRRHLKTAAPALAPVTSPPLKTPPFRHGRHPHLDAAAAASARLPPPPPPSNSAAAATRSSCHVRYDRLDRLVTAVTTISTATTPPPPLRQRQLGLATTTAPPNSARRRDSAPPQHNAIPTVTASTAPAPTSATSTGHPDPTSTGTRRRHPNVATSTAPPRHRPRCRTPTTHARTAALWHLLYYYTISSYM
ncbi:hypothetical protein EDB84DRAFT_1680173 [Lactarius hengduanensis]|nr:hypothetical protein EDB84DRAFT_1680173 [Lactarius hengduanensis]